MFVAVQAVENTIEERGRVLRILEIAVELEKLGEQREDERKGDL